ncbi:MAG: DUF58 domain-containing protein [Saprospiraceae bacterium]
MEVKELLRNVRRIELKTRGLSAEVFSGVYHSAFKGKGMSFSEVRPYQYGDDVRSIDWNVTARTNTPHIKVFEEDRELTVILAIDCSESMLLRTPHKNKQELLAELCAVLSFSGLSNHDKVGAIFFSDKVMQYIPPTKGHFQTLRIVRDLINIKPQEGQTSIAVVLDFINQVFKQRSICFLMSDFWSAGYEKTLKTTARKHDLIGIHVYDPLESHLPKSGFVQLKDPESGRKIWIDTANAAILQSWNDHFEKHSQAIDTRFNQAGAEVLHFDSNASYIKLLQQFFQSRRLRK